MGRTPLALVAFAGPALLAACGVRGDDEPVIHVLAEHPVVYVAGHQVRGTAECSGTVCTVRILGENSEIDLSELDLPSSVSDDRGGINTARLRLSVEQEQAAVSFNTWAGWGQHQAFMPGTGEAVAPGSRIEFAFPVSFGEGTGTNPVSGSASWRGTMLGVRYGQTSGTDLPEEPRPGGGFGADVAGDVNMSVNFSDRSLDLAFTNIQERDTGRSVPPILWFGVPMRNGEFSAAGLEGRFYGPGHEEAGGVFDRNQIVGAFGAKRR